MHVYVCVDNQNSCVCSIKTRFLGARFSGEQLKSLAMIEERITEIRYRFNELKQLQKEHLNGQSQPDAFDVLGRFQPIHGPTLIGNVSVRDSVVAGS